MKLTAIFLAIVVFCSPIAISAQRRVRTRAGSLPVAASRSAAPYTQTLPIRRVILYSNGVAYFERRGMVTGHAEVALQFKQSQVDDVLKSMLVLDLGHGRIGAVSYNSSAPPSARLNDIPFSIAAGTADGTQGGLAGVLKQLQGARVSVATSTRSAVGSVLTVQERKSQIDANKAPNTSQTLVIASESGELMSFDLADVRSIKLIDEGTRRDISQFADATASARRRDAKTILVTSDGEGPREMVVSYTVAAPIWKTTYRVALDSSGQPFFQGWAIIDNVTEEDWQGVSLSLISGTPVSFIQPIQQPLYRYRPVIPIPSDLKLEPQTYESSAENDDNAEAVSVARMNETAGASVLADRVRQMQRDQFLNQNQSTSNSVSVNGLASLAPETSTIGSSIAGQDVGVETAATAEEVGDLFEYRIEQPVSVPHDRSALIPILQTKLEGERVSVFNESVRRDRPMSGMRLKNTSALTLEDGPLTVIDGDAYAGEALLGRFKPGERRLISFALDLGTLVTTRSEPNREPVFRVKAINGYLQVNYYQIEKRTYKITNQTDKARILYIEHPLRSEWKLTSDTEKPIDESRSFYRFRVILEPRKSTDLQVKERHQITESFMISNLGRSDIDLLVARGDIDAETRTALDKILEIKNRISAQDVRIAAINNEKKQIADDQQRLRENITALKDTAAARDLIARYVSKANDQETRIEQLTVEANAAQAERNRLQAELNAAIGQFSIDKEP